MKKKLGILETQLFAYVQMRKLRTLRTGDLVGPLRITAKQERELYSRLAREQMGLPLRNKFEETIRVTLPAQNQ